jgi:hypothetical protein
MWRLWAHVSWLSLKIKVDGLWVVWPQNHWDDFRRFASKLVVTVSGDLVSKPTAMVFAGLASKPVAIVFSSLASKLVAMVSPGLTSKRAVGFLVEP